MVQAAICQCHHADGNRRLMVFLLVQAQQQGNFFPIRRKARHIVRLASRQQNNSQENAGQHPGVSLPADELSPLKKRSIGRLRSDGGEFQECLVTQIGLGRQSHETVVHFGLEARVIP